MPTKVNRVRRHRNALVQELGDQHVEAGERAASQLERLIKNIMKKTLRFSSQFGTGGPAYAGKTPPAPRYIGVRDADIQIDSKVSFNRRRGLQIDMQVLVVDPSGRPHVIWHMLSFGRAPFRQRRTSPPIRARSDLRTTPGTLEVRPFPGYSGKVFVIPAGKIVGRIPPRQWYEAAIPEIKSLLKEYPQLIKLGLRVRRTQVRRPRGV